MSRPLCMEKAKFFARTKDDIPKAAVDFFSIGHVLMGQITFFIVYAMLFFWPGFSESVGDPIKPEFWCVVVSIIVGLIWEPLENILLWKMGLKFEGRKDSWLNIIFDIIFVTAGALLAYAINYWQINLALTIGEFILFFLLRWYFLD